MKLPPPKTAYMTLVCSVVMFTLAGCGGGNQKDDENPEKNMQLAGEIKINGSSTVAPISLAASSKFMKQFPNVKVTVGDKGTGDGFKMFIAGETDISDASRPIKPGELADCQKNHIEFIELPVAYDGLTVVVHPDLAIDQVTVEELKTIFSADTKPKKYSDVNPNWPDTEIKIYAPGDESGTYDYFTEAILGKNGRMRGDYSPNADDNALVTSIAGTKGAIGFFGASYYFGNKDKLKALKVVNPETKHAVLPSPETVESGEYSPLSRPLFIYVNTESNKKPQVREFVKEYINHAGELATSVDYVALPKVIYDRAKTNLKEKKTGTHFVDAQGNSRSGSLKEIYKAENLSGK